MPSLSTFIFFHLNPISTLYLPVIFTIHLSLQLYELASGQLLCSLLFDFGLTCVALDLAEYRLFAGGSNGKIAHIDLFLQVSTNSEIYAIEVVL